MEEKIVVVCPTPACGQKIRLTAAVSGRLHCPSCQAFIEVAWAAQRADVRVVEGGRPDASGADVGRVFARDDDLPVGWKEFADAGAPLPMPIRSPQGVFGKKSADCPRCGRLIDDVDSLVPTRCGRCHAYSIAKRGFLHALDEDYAHPSAVFTLAHTWLSQEHRLPDICCQCGALATRTLSLGSTAERVGFKGSFPYCKRHSAGAVVGSDRIGDKPGHGTWGIKVQSYRFYCEFRRLNGR